MTYIQAFDKIKEKLDGKAKISQDYDSFAIQIKLTNKDTEGNQTDSKGEKIRTESGNQNPKDGKDIRDFRECKKHRG